MICSGNRFVSGPGFQPGRFQKTYQISAPSVALDLPLKVLVAEDSAGKVWVSYNSTDYLQQRHNLTANLVANISVIESLATDVAN